MSQFFLEVTTTNGNVMVNVSEVATMAQEGQGAVIALKNGRKIRVLDTYEEVRAAMTKAETKGEK